MHNILVYHQTPDKKLRSHEIEANNESVEMSCKFPFGTVKYKPLTHEVKYETILTVSKKLQCCSNHISEVKMQVSPDGNQKFTGV